MQKQPFGHLLKCKQYNLVKSKSLLNNKIKDYFSYILIDTKIKLKIYWKLQSIHQFFQTKKFISNKKKKIQKIFF